MLTRKTFEIESYLSDYDLIVVIKVFRKKTVIGRSQVIQLTLYRRSSIGSISHIEPVPSSIAIGNNFLAFSHIFLILLYIKTNCWLFLFLVYVYYEYFKKKVVYDYYSLLGIC